MYVYVWRAEGGWVQWLGGLVVMREGGVVVVGCPLMWCIHPTPKTSHILGILTNFSKSVIAYRSGFR